MALIKKYNTGGSFKEYLKEDLLKNAGSVEVPKEIFERQGTIDPNDESTLEGLSSKGRDYIQNLNSKYKKKSENVSFTNYQLDDKIVRDSDFLKVLKDEFGSLEGIYNHYEKSFLDSGGNDAIKQDLTTRLKNLSDSYFQEHTANPHDNWIRLKEFQNLQQALNIGNWDDIADKSRKLGWNLDSLLFSDDRLKQRQAEKDQERQQAEINTKLQNLQNIGFSPEMAGELLRQGYRPYDNQHFSDYGFMDNLKSLGYNLISNVDNSAHFLTKDGQLVNNYGDWISKDILNKHYGYSIGTDEQGLFKVFKPEEYESNKNVKLWDNYDDTELELIPGLDNDTRFNYHKWYGTSGDDMQGSFGRDALGLRDRTFQITRVDPTTGKRDIYTRNEEGNYLDIKGNKVELPTWNSYKELGQVRHSVDKYFAKNKNSPLYGITAKEATDGSFLWKTPRNIEDSINMIEKVKEEVKRIQSTVGNVKTKNKYRKDLSNSAKHVLYLAEKAEKEGNSDDVEKYLTLLHEVEKIMKATKPYGEEDVQIMQGTTFNKDGGILKAQDRSILKELYKSAAQDTGQAPKAPSISSFNQDKINPGKIKFLNDTVGEADALDILSLVGSGVSMIPVLGVAGGLVTTGADIARGVRDGWSKRDTMNLLANVGFTALAGVGLGAARAGQVGAKVAKVAKTGKNVKGLGSLRIKPTAFSSKVAKGASKMGKAGETADVKRLVDLAKGADKISDVKATSDELRLLSEIAGRRHNWAQSAGISTAKGLYKGAQNLGTIITNPGVGRFAGKAMKGYIGFQGIKGGAQLGRNIAEEEGNIFEKIGKGISNTEVEDIRRIIHGTGIGINQAKGMFRTHAASRNIRAVEGSGTKATTTLKIGDQTFELNKTAEKGKALKSLKPKALKDALTRKESKKLLESLSTEDLKDASQAKAFKDILDGLKPAKEGAKVKIPKVTVSQNASTGFKYELSKDALNRQGQKSYGWWDNILHKSASKSWDKGLKGYYGKTYSWDKANTSKTYSGDPIKENLNVSKSTYSIKDFNKAKSSNFDLDKFKETAKKSAVKPGQIKSKWNKTPNKSVGELIENRNKVKNTYKGINDESPLLGTRTNQIKNMEFSPNRLSKTFRDEYLKLHKKLPDKIKYSSLKNEELKQLFRNDAFKLLSKRGRSLKKGGILKAANGLNLPSYIAPMSERRLRGVGEPFKWEKNFTINPQTSTNKYNLGLNTNANTPLYNTFRSTYDRNMEQPVVNPKEGRSASYEDFKVQDFDPYKDRSQLTKLFGETIKFANTWNTNQNVYQNRIKALNEKAFKMNTMPYTYLRSPGQFNYTTAINTGSQLLDNVKGIMGSSADIDKNAAYKLQVMDQLSKGRSQALAQDAQTLYNHDNMVQQMSGETQRQNLGIDTQQKQLLSDIRSGMFLEGSNKDLQQGNNINTYISQLLHLNSQRPIIKAREDLINAVRDPNALNLSAHIYNLETTKLAEEQKLHKEEEEQRKAFGPTTYQEMKWEDSNRYKIWQEQVMAEKRRLQAMQTLFANRQQLASMLAPTTTEKKQKGGRIPLHEKIALENVRHRNRLTRQTEKEYYKRLLENNKLVQEAMVKVFK